MYAAVKQLLLKPVSYLYAAGVGLRNTAFDVGLLPSKAYSIPVICVGNVLAGGTGKTPMIAYLVKLLGNYKVGIVSRGYGRKTRGLVMADGQATAETIGDEPLQLYSAFHTKVSVAVCEDRRIAIEALQSTVDIIIMDDGMQHRRVKPGLLITLFTADMVARPQYMLPYGRLRDAFATAKRADLLVITKSDCSATGEKEKLLAKVGVNLPVYKAFIKYSDNLPGVYTNNAIPLVKLADIHAVVFTGIAEGKAAAAETGRFAKKVTHLAYADHHNYTTADVTAIITAYRAAGEPAILVTTEKDAMRLHAPHLKHVFLGLPVYYLPVTTEMCCEDRAEFDNKIKAYVERATGNCKLYKH